MNMWFHRVFTFLLVFVSGFTLSVDAQNKPAPSPVPQQKIEPPVRLPKDLVDFFCGEWSGAGEFANGKKIEADAAFMPSLDDQWLVYRHADHAPGIYKAQGMWGYEYTSKTFVMILNDNFGGLRLFTSKGWVDGKLIFLKSDSLSLQKTTTSPATRQERFIFERLTDESFKMTYETSTKGTEWRMSDYLVFKKGS